MANKNDKSNTQFRTHLWRITTLMVVCTILYYLPAFASLFGWESLARTLSIFHDLYTLDLYAMLFFVPVVYAAYAIGVKGAVVTAMVCMLVFIPYGLVISQYPGALFRPTAFVIILSAVGAVIAMLQKKDEERNRSMNELKCLYDIGKAAEKSSSVDQFATSILGIIPRVIPCTDKTRIRIQVRDKAYKHPEFKPSGKKVREKLVAAGEVVGNLELYCSGDCSYLKNGYPLMRTLAERISGAVRNIELEESLNSYYEQLEEMVKQRTEDLEQAQEQLRLLSNTVKSSIDGITLANMEGSLTFANEASQKMWGYSLKELTGMKMSQLYSSDQVDLVENEILPGSKDKAWNGELTAVKKDGHRFPILVTTSPVLDEKGNTVAIVGVHRDITETKEMRDKLIRSERLAAVGELASGIGHELRNPLSVIKNSVYLLKMTLDKEADEETLHLLKLLGQQVDISNKIVTDLLDFTRVKPPAPAGFDLQGLIKESLASVTVPERISINDGLNGNSTRIFADAEQINRAFTNIISNALDSMNGNGKLMINTGVRNGSAWVEFEDNGCGIPEENIDKIFEPLFTTKAKGIGLGLALSKRLVEQNKGTINVASKADKGTTFTVTLPLKNKEAD